MDDLLGSAFSCVRRGVFFDIGAGTIVCLIVKGGALLNKGGSAAILCLKFWFPLPPLQHNPYCAPIEPVTSVEAEERTSERTSIITQASCFYCRKSKKKCLAVATQRWRQRKKATDPWVASIILLDFVRRRSCSWAVRIFCWNAFVNLKFEICNLILIFKSWNFQIEWRNY